MPSDRIDHRWLSAFDSIDVNFDLLPALTVFYYAWLEKEDKIIYKEVHDQLTKVY